MRAWKERALSTAGEEGLGVQGALQGPDRLPLLLKARAGLRGDTHEGSLTFLRIKELRLFI